MANAKRIRGAVRRIALSGLIAVAAMFGVSAADPPHVAACSCAMLGSIEQAADPQSVIVAGTVGGADPAGVRFLVAEWFWGANPAPVVWLAHGSFGAGGGDCTIPQPPAGRQLLLVGYRSRPGDPLNTGLCAPVADLTTAEGQVMLANVRTAFPGVAMTELPTDPPALENSRTPSVAPILIATLIGVFALFAIVIVIARRSRGPST